MLKSMQIRSRVGGKVYFNVPNKIVLFNKNGKSHATHESRLIHNVHLRIRYT